MNFRVNFIDLAMYKKSTLAMLLWLGISSTVAFAQVPAGPPPGGMGGTPELLAGPTGPADFTTWLAGMKQWRLEQKELINYSEAEYNRPEFAWISKNVIHTQMMIEDRYFFDPVSGKYTVDNYLDDLIKRYGGIQSVLIWPSYPNIGIDNRNQYDMIADMPGGIEGVKQMVADFKRRGVRVLFPIMVWDHGTREVDSSMAFALTRLMAEIGADGLNGDTMPGVTEDFFDEYKKADYPLVLEPELGLRTLEMVKWNTMSWGYWNYGAIPGVSTYKWLEPKHMVHVNRRWGTDKTDDVQYSFFNGVGYTTWENIWGIWNGIAERYAASIRRTSKILLYFSDLLSSSDWEPHSPVIQEGVFASKFPGKSQTLWTIINRTDGDLTGRQIRLAHQPNMRYFDLWNGVELIPAREGDDVYLSFDMERKGYGALLASNDEAITADFLTFLKEMNAESKVKLHELSAEWRPIPQTMVEIPATAPLLAAPKDMVLIPEAKGYRFESKGLFIEGDQLPSAIGVQHPWEDTSPARSHQHDIDIKPFYMDRYPVTNAEFKKFMDATQYQPKEPHNFLKHWENGTYPEGHGNKPVTWVSLSDARAYASWAGKRLPHEWEWQYAAQGMDRRLYPWGNVADSTRVPRIGKGRDMPPLSDVDAHPEGASPFGVLDLVGNIWQWTDEYSDEHTRFAILKGSTNYRPQGSWWYFPQANELYKYGKYLLMYDGRDRSASIGFRCVADL